MIYGMIWDYMDDMNDMDDMLGNYGEIWRNGILLVLHPTDPLGRLYPW